MPTVLYELPYEGAKEMLLVDEVDNKEFLTGLFHAMYDELPAPKPKKKKYKIQLCQCYQPGKLIYPSCCNHGNRSGIVW